MPPTPTGSRFQPDQFGWLSSPLPLGLLQVVAALMMVLPLLFIPVTDGNAGMMNIVESIGALDRVALWQHTIGRAFGSPGFRGWDYLSPAGVFVSFSMGLALLFCLQGLAFRSAWRSDRTSPWPWLIGPLGTHIVMIAMVPSNADVFYYEMSGDLANQGINPYLHKLAEFPNNPIFPYNHWVDMATVYGPAWTRINQLVMWSVGPDPTAATLVYKLVLGAVAILLACLVYQIAARLTGNRSHAVAAFVLVAWQPNLILESTGQAHSDAVMLLVSTLGMMLVLLGSQSGIRGAIVLVTLSAMVKYVTLPLVGILGLVRLFDRQPVHKLLKAWLLDGLAVAAVVVASFLPFWGGASTFNEMFTEPGRLFAHPFWQLQSVAIKALFSAHVKGVYEAVVRAILQAATLVGLGYAAWLVIDASRRSSEDLPAAPVRSRARTQAILTSWTIILSVLAFVPANSHSWYWTWPVVPISLLLAFGGTRPNSPVDGTPATLPGWFWSYLVLTAVLTLVYHSRIIRL